MGWLSCPFFVSNTHLAGPGPAFLLHTAVTCAPLTAYNASFSSVLIGSSSGACLVGYAGTISSQCLLNSTSGSTAYFSAPSGTCTRTERLETTFRAGHARIQVRTAANKTSIPFFAPVCTSSPHSPDLLERRIRVRQLARLCSVRPGRLRQRHLPAGLPDHRPVRPYAASVHGRGHLHVDHPQPVHPYVPRIGVRQNHTNAI